MSLLLVENFVLTSAVDKVFAKKHCEAFTGSLTAGVSRKISSGLLRRTSGRRSEVRKQDDAFMNLEVGLKAAHYVKVQY